METIEGDRNLQVCMPFFLLLPVIPLHKVYTLSPEVCNAHMETAPIP